MGFPLPGPLGIASKLAAPVLQAVVPEALKGLIPGQGGEKPEGGQQTPPPSGGADLV